MSANQANDKKSRGFGRFMSNKREKTPERPPLPDSAYGSATPSSNTEYSRQAPSPANNNASNQEKTQEMVPAEKDSDIANIDKDKNLALKPSTGEVFDQDTGQVVTVVTTTTTTTTISRPGQEPEVNKDVHEQEQRIEQPAVGGAGAKAGSGTGAGAEAAPRNPPNDSSLRPPGIQEMPAQNSYSGRRPTDSSPSQQQQQSPPSIPTRSPNRRSQDYSRETPISPIDSNTSYQYPGGSGNNSYDPSYNSGAAGQRPSNFSYPSRSSPQGAGQPTHISTTNQPQQNSKNTMADLKAAAKGLHGVGETLRGTLNDTIDRNFPRSDAERAAAANAKNQGVLNNGRTEIDRINSGQGQYADQSGSTGQRSSGGLRNFLKR